MDSQFFFTNYQDNHPGNYIEVMKLRMDNDIFSSQISRLYLFLYVFF